MSETNTDAISVDDLIELDDELEDFDPELRPTNISDEDLAKMLKKSGRAFFFSQQVKDPNTGETLLTEADIKKGVGHKMIKQYAYILHDKDTYTKSDIENLKAADAKYDRTRETYPNVGDLKPPHYHILLGSAEAMTIKQVSKWFNTPPNFIEKVRRGQTGFNDCLAYELHETYSSDKEHKHHYADDEMHASFDFRAVLDRRATELAKYGKQLEGKEALRQRILNDGLTLRQAMEQEPVLYADDYSTLSKMRGQYLLKVAPLPSLRLNFYISGPGGIGKDALARMLANIWYPDKDYDEIAFEVSDLSAGFNNYDGQPVIIWSDVRASDIIAKFGRSTFFSMIDIRPHNVASNIKYATTRLVNEINIFTGVESYEDFLNGLCGEYKDAMGVWHNDENSFREQSYRRFPMIIEVSEDDLTFLANKGFMEGSRDYNFYMRYAGIRANMQEVMALPEEKREVSIDNMRGTVNGVKDDLIEAGNRAPDFDDETAKRNGVVEYYYKAKPKTEPVELDASNGYEVIYVEDDETKQDKSNDSTPTELGSV